MANKRPNMSGLKPFQKGQSGNPNGRPKGISVRDVLRDALTRPGEDGGPSVIEKWVAELGLLKNQDMLLDALRFTEGNQPPTGADGTQVDAKPRIVIPGSAGPES